MKEGKDKKKARVLRAVYNDSCERNGTRCDFLVVYLTRAMRL
jgi:hypothetical protein